MTLTGLLVDTGTVATGFFGLASISLLSRRIETDTHRQAFSTLWKGCLVSPAGTSQCGTAIPRMDCLCSAWRIRAWGRPMPRPARLASGSGPNASNRALRSWLGPSIRNTAPSGPSCPPGRPAPAAIPRRQLRIQPGAILAGAGFEWKGGENGQAMTREALSNKPIQSGLNLNLLVMNSFRADRALFGEILPIFWHYLVEFRPILP